MPENRRIIAESRDLSPAFFHQAFRRRQETSMPDSSRTPSPIDSRRFSNQARATRPGLSRPKALARRLGLPLALTTLAMLAGCADMAAKVPPGAPLAQVEADYGRPNFTCVRPGPGPGPDGGGQRVIWTQQPLGQYAWGANVGADGWSGC
jgi:hypothetical protein